MAASVFDLFKVGIGPGSLHTPPVVRHRVPKPSYPLVQEIQPGHRHLKTGTNVLTAYGNVEYDQKTQEPRSQMDLCIEGLRMADLR